MRSLILAALMLPFVAACATGTTQTATSSSSTVLTAADLSGVTELNALDAIRRLRPNWLRSRATPTPAAFASGGVLPALRVDNSERSSLDELQSMPVRDVQEIRFMSASDATTMYGTGYTNGLILVRTKGM